jgi:hypothetical protein
MSLSRQIETVRAAEADVVLAHQDLLCHLQNMRARRDDLITPGRIIGAGLAVGFVAGHAAPALRNATVRHDIEHGADLLQRLTRLASTAMPLLMPLVMRRSDDASDRDGDASDDPQPGPAGYG